jgi:hypothetical protein
MGNKLCRQPGVDDRDDIVANVTGLCNVDRDSTLLFESVEVKIAPSLLPLPLSDSAGMVTTRSTNLLDANLSTKKCYVIAH